jgi:hypothetical protein
MSVWSFVQSESVRLHNLNTTPFGARQFQVTYLVLVAGASGDPAAAPAFPTPSTPSSVGSCSWTQETHHSQCFSHNTATTHNSDAITLACLRSSPKTRKDRSGESETRWSRPQNGVILWKLPPMSQSAVSRPTVWAQWQPVSDYPYPPPSFLGASLAFFNLHVLCSTFAT